MKMLGSKSISQRHILHIIYILSKINIPKYTLRTTEIKIRSQDNPQGCFCHNHYSVWGGGNCQKISTAHDSALKQANKSSNSFQNTFSCCLWHMLNTYQQNWSVCFPFIFAVNCSEETMTGKVKKKIIYVSLHCQKSHIVGGNKGQKNKTRKDVN